MKPCLLVMAAGLGSRYGGLKQVDPLGPSGESLLDYAVYDAIRGGFGRVVFVIREQMADDIAARVARMKEHLPLDFAYQRGDDLPVHTELAATRVKPWGTAHAVYAARHLIEEPFAVINADDFYGPSAFTQMADFLADPSGGQPGNYAMLGYALHKTLSAHGHVNRGICELDDGYLHRVVERCEIAARGEDVFYTDAGGLQPISPDVLVSMNMWGFRTDFFAALEDGLKQFIQCYGRDGAEFQLPAQVDRLIRQRKARVKVLPTAERWFGVTYREDREHVVAALREMVTAGVYPQALWEAA